MSDGVRLRAEHDGEDRRFLTARVDGAGDLFISGQDLGPATRMVSSDGEYEWTTTIRAAHVPRLVALLGGDEATPVLELLEARYTGAGSYELERIIRESDIPVERFVWSG